MAQSLDKLEPIMSANAGADAAKLVRGRSAGYVLLAVVVLGAAVRFAVVLPARNYLLDFRCYYAAGAASSAGVNPYDTAAVRQAIDLPGDQMICRYVYPPPTVPLMQLVATLPYPAVQIAWCLLQFVAGMGAVLWMLRALGIELASPPALLVVVAFVISPAFSELFRWGQFDMLLLALIVAAIVDLRRDRPTRAGVWLGLAAAAKLTPLLLLAALMLCRKRRALAASCASFTIAMLIGFAAVGSAGVEQWVIGLRAFGSEPQGNISPENMSLLAFAFRAFVNQPSFQGPSMPWIDLGPVAAVAAYRIAAVSLVLVSFGGLWMNRKRLRADAAIALLMPVALLISPRTWTHHTVTLIVPLAYCVHAVLKSRFARRSDWWLLAGAFALFTLSPVLQFELSLPSRLAHLFTPMPTYAAFATWLFMLLRYPPLVQTDKIHVDDRLKTQSEIRVSVSRSPVAWPVASMRS